MARTLTTDEKTALAASSNRPAFFFEGTFSDGTVLRLWTGLRSVTFQGHTFLGNGWLTGISPAPEIGEIRAAGISIELSFLTPTIQALVLSSSKGKATGKLWLCMMDQNWAVIGNGYQCFSGRIDSSEIQYSGVNARVSVKYETVLARLLVRKENRYSDQNQQLFYPGDLGFQYIVQAQQWSGYWGQGGNKLLIRRRDRR